MFCPCSALVAFMCWTGNSMIHMNNLLSYCWLVDARISASEKDLLVKEGRGEMSKKLRKTHLIVSRKVFLSLISSGIRARILLRATDFLFNSWKGSSVLLERYSIPESIIKRRTSQCTWLTLDDEQWDNIIFQIIFFF